MKIQHASGTLKKFKRATWRFQCTFKTPLNDIKRFVSVIVSSHPNFSGASLTIDNIVFTPRNLLSVITNESAADSKLLLSDTAIITNSDVHAQTLLAAALLDAIDILFVPEPKPFVIYADHDEYSTFYASTRSNLNRVRTALSNAGFVSVEDYVRS